MMIRARHDLAAQPDGVLGGVREAAVDLGADARLEAGDGRRVE